jgi:hypothetical protein
VFWVYPDVSKVKTLQLFETVGTAPARTQCHIPEDLRHQFYLVLYSPGHWVLLDEINLASAETLECLSGLLEGSTGSVFLLERGDQKPIERHPDFQLFACMNPATDVGKKDLPAGLRNRFVQLLRTCLENVRLLRTFLENDDKLHSFGGIANILCLSLLLLSATSRCTPHYKKNVSSATATLLTLTEVSGC